MSAVLQFNGLTLQLLASNSCMAWLEDEDTEAGKEPASALSLARPQEQEQAGQEPGATLGQETGATLGQEPAEPLGQEPGATLGGLAHVLSSWIVIASSPTFSCSTSSFLTSFSLLTSSFASAVYFSDESLFTEVTRSRMTGCHTIMTNS